MCMPVSTEIRPPNSALRCGVIREKSRPTDFERELSVLSMPGASGPENNTILQETWPIQALKLVWE